MKSKAYAGNSNLEVLISFSTRGTTNLQLLKIEASDASKITFKRIHEEVSFDPETGLLTTEFRYVADIPAATEPRIYLITLSLGYPGEKKYRFGFLVVCRCAKQWQVECGD